MLPADTPPSPPAVPVVVSVTAENVRVSDQMKMGMVGLHYLRPLMPEAAPNWYGGISVYGATHGDRGGFFAWGLTSGYRANHGPWQADAGLFVGGGGGGPSWTGGGLMLRPHLQLSHAWGDVSLGVGVSRVTFPSGVVRSTQPYATLAWRSTGLFGAAGGGQAVGDWGSSAALAQAMPSEVAAIGGQYRMRGAVARNGVTGTGALSYGGVALRRNLSHTLLGTQPYWLISAAGAISGGYDGYAEMMGGVGTRWALPMLPSVALSAEAALGSGGAGAAADTGGGLLRKLTGGLSWQLAPQLSLSAMAGRVESRGRFSATETRLELAYHGWDVLPGERRVSGAAPSSLAWEPWSFSAGWVEHPQMLRDNGRSPQLGVLALKLERELDAHWRLTGQAATGVNGNAGGYATGNLGLGWLTARSASSPWRVGAEASLGAAGGGGVRVSGGLFGQAQLQARYALSRDLAVQADVGWLRSMRGNLSSPLVGVSAVYSFSRLQGR